MGDVLIVHPETGGEAVVPAEALEHHYRNSGWMAKAEYEEHLAAQAERAAAQDTAGKSSSKKAANEGTS